MNPTEAASLCRFAKAACPQQAIDEHTPDAWGLLLTDINFEDAKAALVEHVRRSPFVSPAEIIAGVKRIRAKRIEEHPPLTPPADLTPAQTIEWLRDARRRIADGEAIDCDAEYGELKPRHLPDLRQILPRVEDDTTDEESA